MITYTCPWPDQPTFKVPVLHKVNFNSENNWREIHQWCKENCCAPFYLGPSWNDNFVEFEDDTDAVHFALRFA